MIAVGLMSGTSADGVSLAAIRLGKALEFLAYRTFPYPKALRGRILLLPPKLEPRERSKLSAKDQAAASYRRKTGIMDASGRRHTVDSYVALRPQDLTLLTASRHRPSPWRGAPQWWSAACRVP